MSEIVFVAEGSGRGRNVVFKDRFKFVFQKLLADGETSRWTCAGRKKFGCKAYLKMVGSELLDSADIHSHQAEEFAVDKCLMRRTIKRKASDELTIQIVRSALREYPSPDINVTQLYAFRQVAYRAKKKKIPLPLPKSRADVFSFLLSLDTTTTKGDEFLLCADAQQEIVIFSCTPNLQCLAATDWIYIDGTFKYCPKEFYQLLTVHGYLQGLYIPLAFCLLPSKTEEMYALCLRRLKEKCKEIVDRDMNRSTCVADFEVR